MAKTRTATITIDKAEVERIILDYFRMVENVSARTCKFVLLYVPGDYNESPSAELQRVEIEAEL